MFRVSDARENLEERREPLQQIFSAKDSWAGHHFRDNPETPEIISL
jgi:hypothetical protein